MATKYLQRLGTRTIVDDKGAPRPEFLEFIDGLRRQINANIDTLDTLVETSSLTVTGAATLSGATAFEAEIGFYGTTPASQPSAYTQTYATATKTHNAETAATAVAITDSTGSTPDQTVAAVTDNSETTNNATINDNFADIVDEINKLLADVQNVKIDLLNVKQVLNAVIDDAQSLGLFQ